MLTLRGVALGAAMYVAFLVLYIFFSVRSAHLGPGQQVGWDFHTMFAIAIRNPMFYITFIVLATVGSGLIQAWKNH